MLESIEVDLKNIEKLRDFSLLKSSRLEELQNRENELNERKYALTFGATRRRDWQSVLISAVAIAFSLVLIIGIHTGLETGLEWLDIALTILLALVILFTGFVTYKMDWVLIDRHEDGSFYNVPTGKFYKNYKGGN